MFKVFECLMRQMYNLYLKLQYLYKNKCKIIYKVLIYNAPNFAPVQYRNQ
jgi:hypothetical protein